MIKIDEKLFFFIKYCKAVYTCFSIPFVLQNSRDKVSNSVLASLYIILELFF